MEKTIIELWGSRPTDDVKSYCQGSRWLLCRAMSLVLLVALGCIAGLFVLVYNLRLPVTVTVTDDIENIVINNCFATCDPLSKHGTTYATITYPTTSQLQVDGSSTDLCSVRLSISNTRTKSLAFKVADSTLMLVTTGPHTRDTNFPFDVTVTSSGTLTGAMRLQVGGMRFNTLTVDSVSALAVLDTTEELPTTMTVDVGHGMISMPFVSGTGKHKILWEANVSIGGYCLTRYASSSDNYYTVDDDTTYNYTLVTGTLYGGFGSRVVSLTANASSIYVTRPEIEYKDEGSMMNISQTLRPLVEHALVNTADFTRSLINKMYVQTIEIIAPFAGTKFLNTNTPFIVQFGAEFMSLLSGFQLTPSYRSMNSALDHYTCSNDTYINSISAGIIVNPFSATSATVAATDISTFKYLPLSSIRDVYRRIENITWPLSIFTAFTVVTYDLRQSYNVMAQLKTFNVNGNEFSIHSVERTTGQWVLLGMTVGIGAYVAVGVCFLLIYFRASLFKALYLHEQRLFVRQLVHTVGSCPYFLYMSLYSFQSMCSLQIIRLSAYAVRSAITTLPMEVYLAWMLKDPRKEYEAKLEFEAKQAAEKEGVDPSSSSPARAKEKINNRVLPDQADGNDDFCPGARLITVNELLERYAIMWAARYQPRIDFPQEKVREILKDQGFDVKTREISVISGVAALTSNTERGGELVFDELYKTTKNTFDDAAALAIANTLYLEKPITKPTERSVIEEAKARKMLIKKSEQDIITNAKWSPAAFIEKITEEQAARAEASFASFPSFVELRPTLGFDSIDTTYGYGAVSGDIKQWLLHKVELVGLGIAQAAAHIIVMIWPCAFMFIMIQLFMAETTKYSISSRQFALVELLWGYYTTEVSYISLQSIATFVTCGVFILSILEPLVVIIFRMLSLDHVMLGEYFIRYPITVIISVIYGLLSFLVIVYVICVLLWWILGAIIAPDVMLAFASSAATLFAVMAASYASLESSRTTIIERVKERILEALLDLLKKSGFEMSEDALGSDDGITIGLLADVADQKPDAIEKLGTILQVPGPILVSILAIQSRDPAKLREAGKQMIELADLPKQFQPIVGLALEKVLGFSVPVTKILHALYELVPDPDAKKLLLSADHALCPCVEAIINPDQKNMDRVRDAVVAIVSQFIVDKTQGKITKEMCQQAVDLVFSALQSDQAEILAGIQTVRAEGEKLVKRAKNVSAKAVAQTIMEQKSFIMKKLLNVLDEAEPMMQDAMDEGDIDWKMGSYFQLFKEVLKFALGQDNKFIMTVLDNLYEILPDEVSDLGFEKHDMLRLWKHVSSLDPVAQTVISGYFQEEFENLSDSDAEDEEEEEEEDDDWWYDDDDEDYDDDDDWWGESSSEEADEEERSGSHHSGSGSGSGSHHSGSGSDHEDGEEDGSGSHHSSGSGSGGSHHSGSGSGSHHSGHSGSGSHRSSRSGSHRSGSHRSGSYRSGSRHSDAHSGDGENADGGGNNNDAASENLSPEEKKKRAAERREKARLDRINTKKEMSYLPRISAVLRGFFELNNAPTAVFTLRNLYSCVFSDPKECVQIVDAMGIGSGETSESGKRLTINAKETVEGAQAVVKAFIDTYDEAMEHKAQQDEGKKKQQDAATAAAVVAANAANANASNNNANASAAAASSSAVPGATTTTTTGGKPNPSSSAATATAAAAVTAKTTTTTTTTADASVYTIPRARVEMCKEHKPVSLWLAYQWIHMLRLEYSDIEDSVVELFENDCCGGHLVLSQVKKMCGVPEAALDIFSKFVDISSQFRGLIEEQLAAIGDIKIPVHECFEIFRNAIPLGKRTVPTLSTSPISVIREHVRSAIAREGVVKNAAAAAAASAASASSSSNKYKVSNKSCLWNRLMPKSELDKAPQVIVASSGGEQKTVGKPQQLISESEVKDLATDGINTAVDALGLGSILGTGNTRKFIDILLRILRASMPDLVPKLKRIPGADTPATRCVAENSQRITKMVLNRVITRADVALSQSEKTFERKMLTAKAILGAAWFANMSKEEKDTAPREQFCIDLGFGGLRLFLKEQAINREGDASSDKNENIAAMSGSGGGDSSSGGGGGDEGGGGGQITPFNEDLQKLAKKLGITDEELLPLIRPRKLIEDACPWASYLYTMLDPKRKFDAQNSHFKQFVEVSSSGAQSLVSRKHVVPYLNLFANRFNSAGNVYCEGDENQLEYPRQCFERKRRLQKQGLLFCTMVKSHPLCMEAQFLRGMMDAIVWFIEHDIPDIDNQLILLHDRHHQRHREKQTKMSKEEKQKLKQEQKKAEKEKKKAEKQAQKQQNKNNATASQQKKDMEAAQKRLKIRWNLLHDMIRTTCPVISDIGFVSGYSSQHEAKKRKQEQKEGGGGSHSSSHHHHHRVKYTNECQTLADYIDYFRFISAELNAAGIVDNLYDPEVPGNDSNSPHFDPCFRVPEFPRTVADFKIMFTETQRFDTFGDIMNGEDETEEVVKKRQKKQNKMLKAVKKHEMRQQQKSEKKNHIKNNNASAASAAPVSFSTAATGGGGMQEIPVENIHHDENESENEHKNSPDRFDTEIAGEEEQEHDHEPAPGDRDNHSDNDNDGDDDDDYLSSEQRNDLITIAFQTANPFLVFRIWNDYMVNAYAWNENKFSFSLANFFCRFHGMPDGAGVEENTGEQTAVGETGSETLKGAMGAISGFCTLLVRRDNTPRTTIYGLLEKVPDRCRDLATELMHMKAYGASEDNNIDWLKRTSVELMKAIHLLELPSNGPAGNIEKKFGQYMVLFHGAVNGYGICQSMGGPHALHWVAALKGFRASNNNDKNQTEEADFFDDDDNKTNTTAGATAQQQSSSNNKKQQENAFASTASAAAAASASSSKQANNHNEKQEKANHTTTINVETVNTNVTTSPARQNLTRAMHLIKNAQRLTKLRNSKIHYTRDEDVFAMIKKAAKDEPVERRKLLRWFQLLAHGNVLALGTVCAAQLSYALGKRKDGGGDSEQTQQDDFELSFFKSALFALYAKDEMIAPEVEDFFEDVKIDASSSDPRHAGENGTGAATNPAVVGLPEDAAKLLFTPMFNRLIKATVDADKTGKGDAVGLLNILDPALVGLLSHMSHPLRKLMELVDTTSVSGSKSWVTACLAISFMQRDWDTATHCFERLIKLLNGPEILGPLFTIFVRTGADMLAADSDKLAVAGNMVTNILKLMYKAMNEEQKEMYRPVIKLLHALVNKKEPTFELIMENMRFMIDHPIAMFLEEEPRKLIHRLLDSCGSIQSEIKNNPEENPVTVVVFELFDVSTELVVPQEHQSKAQIVKDFFENQVRPLFRKAMRSEGTAAMPSIDVPLLMRGVEFAVEQLPPDVTNKINMLSRLFEGDLSVMPGLAATIGIEISADTMEKIFALVEFIKTLTSDGGVEKIKDQAVDAAKDAAKKYVDKIIDYVFEQFDTEGTGKVSFNCFLALLKRLHISLPVAEAKALFAKADIDKSGYIDRSEFRQVVEELQNLMKDRVLDILGLSNQSMSIQLVLLLLTLTMLLAFVLIGVATFSDGSSFTAVISGSMPFACGGLTKAQGSLDQALNAADRAVQQLVATLKSAV